MKLYNHFFKKPELPYPSNIEELRYNLKVLEAYYSRRMLITFSISLTLSFLVAWLLNQ